METMQCQVCFEDSNEAEMVTRLCGSECSAQICRPCLARHLHVSLDQFYPGLLPKLRCPICLTFILREQWASQLGDLATDLSARYESLCAAACSFYSPCCHNANYTHLPNFDEALASPSSERPQLKADENNESGKDNEEVDHVLEALLAAEKTPNWRFPELCRDFCAFQQDASSVVTAFLEGVFSVESPEETQVGAGKVFSKALSRIRDPERRATLLLWYLYKYPATFTRCCDRAVCFNCKRATDHKVCQRKEEEAFDEETCMLQCRQCRTSIVKVEGCDTVICLCGFLMDWVEELSFKVDNRRHLIPVDMFDFKRFDEWRDWKAKTLRLVRNLSRVLRKRELRIRQQELSKLMLAWPSAMTKLRLLVAVSVWKIRFRKLLKKRLPGMRDMAQRMCLRRRTRLLLATIGVQLRCFVWRRRFRKMRSAFELELFWAVYRRAHPEEVEDAEAAEADLFAMALIDEL
ncbi:hypothetical protein BBJ28_00023592 [Nothophytophthora sp. Chile5]|nr:hypothetical protein BBJ28_00023592 [Nothophytophthora sp. Chile5]